MNETRKRRLFVGMELPSAARAACAAVSEMLCKTGFAAKYEAADKLHVTVAFLGYVEPFGYEAVVAKFFESAARAAPFSLTLDKVGAFPHERKPRVVYIGARDQGASFPNLSQEVRSAYAELGFAFAGDSVPHVTIARVKAPSRPVPLIEFPAIPLSLKGLTLFESLPDKLNSTSRYEATATAPFLLLDGRSFGSSELRREAPSLRDASLQDDKRS